MHNSEIKEEAKIKKRLDQHLLHGFLCCISEIILPGSV